MTNKPHHDLVWGLDLSGGAARLVGLRRDGDGWRVEVFKQAAPAPGDDPVALDLSRLADEPLDGPVAVTIPDEAVLYRSLALPSGDPAQLDKMVRGQLEVMLPTRADWFTSGWAGQGSAADGMGRVLMAAVRTELIERITAAARPLTPRPAVLTPSAVALTRAYENLAAAPGEVVALVNIEARTTSVVLIVSGNIIACGTLDSSVSAEPGGEADLQDFINELGDLYRALAADAASAGSPVRAIVFGRAAQVERVVSAVASALRIPAQPIAAPRKLALPTGTEHGEIFSAVGAAMSLIDGGKGTINLAAGAEPVAAKRRPFTRRGKLAAAWLIAALVGFYLIDRREAGWLEASVQRIAEAGGARGIDERLAIAAYLQQQAATPLATLEVWVSSMPQAVVPVNWTYTRQGEFRFLGRSQDPAQADAFLKKLAESKLFKSVEIKSLKLDPQRQRWDIEIIGQLQSGQPPATQPAAATTAPSPAAPPAPATRPGEPQHQRKRGEP